MSIETISVNCQIINMIVTDKEHEDWLLSIVYASPRVSIRKCLWEYIRRLDAVVKYPWMITGDLKEIISEREKFGRKPINWPGQNNLIELLSHCNLIVLECEGLPLTWSNCSEGRDKVKKKKS